MNPNAIDYPDPCIALPPEADDELIKTLCQQHTAALDAWIIEQKKNPQAQLTKTRYDGSVLSGCRIYQEHPLSPFKTVSLTTRRGYLNDLKVLETTVGGRLFKNVTIMDCKFWYGEWRKGAVIVDEDGNRTIGPERIERAHKAAAMLRTVVYFLSALRYPDCKLLAGELEKVRFERGAAREQELTYQQARAFIRAAVDLGERRVIPPERALYMAIAIAAQFELMLRPKDIIGGWEPTRADRRLPKGISTVHLAESGETWAGFFTWESIPGWRWRMKTSKSKYRAPAEFDLTMFDLLFPLLEQVPAGERERAIVKGEHGLPIRYRSYVKWFRQIATVAGIPLEVQSRDSRAGGATEADDAGVREEDIQNALTHSNIGTTRRYIRRRNRKIADVATARKENRAANDDGTR